MIAGAIIKRVEQRYKAVDVHTQFRQCPREAKLYVPKGQLESCLDPPLLKSSAIIKRVGQRKKAVHVHPVQTVPT